MELSRRGFLGRMLALAAAPAIVRAESLMPIYVPKLYVPDYSEWLPQVGDQATVWIGDELRHYIRVGAGCILLATVKDQARRATVEDLTVLPRGPEAANTVYKINPKKVVLAESGKVIAKKQYPIAVWPQMI